MLFVDMLDIEIHLGAVPLEKRHLNSPLSAGKAPFYSVIQTIASIPKPIVIHLHFFWPTQIGN